MHPGLSYTQEIQFGFKDSLPWVADCFFEVDDTQPPLEPEAENPQRSLLISVADEEYMVSRSCCSQVHQ